MFIRSKVGRALAATFLFGVCLPLQAQQSFDDFEKIDPRYGLTIEEARRKWFHDMRATPDGSVPGRLRVEAIREAKRTTEARQASRSGEDRTPLGGSKWKSVGPTT